MLGYLAMGMAFLVLRFFYHILPSKKSHDSFIQAVRKDWENLYAYAKQVFLCHRKILKIIVVTVPLYIVIPIMPYRIEITYTIEDFLGTIVFSLLVFVFAPHEDPSRKGFPVEIFGFVYSVIFMFYSFGALVFDVFFFNNFFGQYMWIFGYSITIISYVVCIATISRFMERYLTTVDIVLLGMIMMTTLEFITYYGIGFFSGSDVYNAKDYEGNPFGNITVVINRGIYIASQSQILERAPAEIWGYIILNGTDVLTVTVVLGYIVQKFFVNSSSGL